jgi:hypothetical protein
MKTAWFGRNRWWVLALLLCCSAGWLSGNASAEDIRESTSLKFVPEDVAFYSTSLRMREQYDAFVQSKAFKALSEMPVVSTAVAFTNMWAQNDDRAKAVLQALEMEENKEAVAALLDAVSHEIFLYGSEGFGDLVRLANDLSRVQQQAQFQALAEGVSPEEIVAQKVLEKLTSMLENAKLPHTVLGFRVSDKDRAAKQLARLESLLKEVLAQEPELAKRFSREKIGDAEYLTLKLDGSMVPWDEVFEKAGDKREQVEKLAEKVKPMTLVIAIGLWNDYLIVSSGENTSHLAKLGQGARLADRKEFKQIEKHLDQRIVGVGYVSESFVRKTNSVPQQVDDAVELAKQFLPQANLEEDVEKELLNDIGRLASALKKHVPEPGAMVSVNFLTSRGYEGYGYSWAKNTTVDASQPLTVLKHLGGSPIFAAAVRGKQDPRCYDAISECASRIMYYVEKIGMKDVSDEERELFTKMRDELMPLVKRMGDVTRDQLLPAMKDGQMAVAVDAKSTSEQWHEMMPQAKNALPMLEVAMLFGVNDSEAVDKAAAEYFSILQEMLKKVHSVSEEIPEIELPEPNTKESAEGKIYFYGLPPSAGLDKQFAPSMGLAKDVLAFSLLPKQTQRTLASTPLKLEGPMADLDRPLGSLVHVSIAGLIDAISPWVDYGFTVASEGEDNPVLDTIKPQVQSALNVLKCIRGVTAVSYQEDELWVTHMECELQDLP